MRNYIAGEQGKGNKLTRKDDTRHAPRSSPPVLSRTLCGVGAAQSYPTPASCRSACPPAPAVPAPAGGRSAAGRPRAERQSQLARRDTVRQPRQGAFAQRAGAVGVEQLGGGTWVNQGIRRLQGARGRDGDNGITVVMMVTGSGGGTAAKSCRTAVSHALACELGRGEGRKQYRHGCGRRERVAHMRAGRVAWFVVPRLAAPPGAWGSPSRRWQWTLGRSHVCCCRGRWGRHVC